MYEERRWLIRNPILVVVLVVVSATLLVAPEEPGGRWVAVLVAAIMLPFHIHVRVDEEGVRPFMFPVYGRRIPYRDIRDVAVVDYKWWKFGGWGLRFGDGALAYSVWEKQAVRIFRDGRDVVIGSGDPERLAAEIREHLLVARAAGA